MPAQPDQPSWRLTRRGLAVVAALVVGVALVVAFVVRGTGEDTVPVAHRATTSSPTSSDPPTVGEPTGTPSSRTLTPSAGTPTVTPSVVNGRVQPPRIEPPTAASGHLVVVPGTTPPVQGQRVWTYRVEVEQGLPFDGPEFAAAVHATLSDPRGWATDGNVFQRVNGDADMRIILASPALTDQLCAPLRTQGEVSCRNGDLVVLNALRWGTGIDDYHGDLVSYREYLVNHEVGHRLGRSHVQCPGPGKPAPVMMQQTYGLDGCTPNAWPLAGE